VQWSCGSSGAAILLVWVLALTVAPGAQAFDAGDAVITEIMIAPNDSHREWFEVRAMTDGLSLDGCVLLYGESAVPPADPANPGEDWDSHLVEDAALVADEGDFLTFSKGADDPCIGWTDETLTVCDVEADHTYTEWQFSNEDLHYLILTCEEGGGGWTMLDAAPVDWKNSDHSLYVACGEDNGCSANLNPDYYDSIDNDDIHSWCVALATDTYIDRDAVENRGSPGEQGECIPEGVHFPEPGEVIVVELMVNPARAYSAEWFELQNVTADALDLGGCKLRKERDDSDTIEEISLPTGLRIGADGIVLFASECIEGVGGDDDSASADGDCSLGEVLDGDIGFTDGVDHTFQLHCPGNTAQGTQQIDSINFNDVEQGIREGHSMMFVPADHGDPGAANDDRSSWCEAAFSQCFLDSDGVDCEYGTPGQHNECLTDFVDWPDNGPACRCVLSRDPVAPTLAAVVVALASLIGLRRRR